MIRMTELPQAIYRAINGWRVWVTLMLLTALILNEAVVGIKEGQSVVDALTRISYFKMALLLFVCGVMAQAAIGTVPFAMGVTMTMIDFALNRRQNWREEGIELGRNEGIELGRNEGIELGRAEERARAEEKQRNISAIMANPQMTSEAKLQAIAAINSNGIEND